MTALVKNTRDTCRVGPISCRCRYSCGGSQLRCCISRKSCWCFGLLWCESSDFMSGQCRWFRIGWICICYNDNVAYKYVSTCIISIDTDDAKKSLIKKAVTHFLVDCGHRFQQWFEDNNSTRSKILQTDWFTYASAFQKDSQLLRLFHARLNFLVLRRSNSFSTKTARETSETNLPHVGLLSVSCNKNFAWNQRNWKFSRWSRLSSVLLILSYASSTKAINVRLELNVKVIYAWFAKELFLIPVVLLWYVVVGVESVLAGSMLRVEVVCSVVVDEDVSS